MPLRPQSSRSRSESSLNIIKVQLNKLGVEIHEHTELSIDSPILAECDRIVWQPVRSRSACRFPGINGSNVLGVIDAHLKPELVTGRNLIICGGGMSGCDFALEAMTALGRKATVIEMKDDVATDVIMMNQVSLKESMAEAGVALRCGCRVKEITGNGVVVINKDGGEELIEGDQVISAFGQTPDKDMVNKLRDKYYKKPYLSGTALKQQSPAMLYAAATVQR